MVLKKFRKMKKVFFWAVSLIFFISCSTENRVENSAAGFTLGTSFHVKFISDKSLDIQEPLDSIFKEIVGSMSTYVSNSDITKINNGDTSIVVDKMFTEVYELSKRINEETDGMFDPTVGIIVNAWGFGPKRQLADLDSAKVTELMNYVGISKTRIDQNGVFVKDHLETQIDFNAIAKGYTVDMVAKYLESIGVKDYLVEIGGEIVAKGVKLNGEKWRIGIDQPLEINDGSRPLNTVLSLTDIAMATSGNYRNFHIDTLTGEKYVHTMNARTGYPSKSNMLSATVLASDCASADAYATTFMAMGLKESRSFLEQHSEIEAYLIYTNFDGEYKIYKTKYFDKNVVKN
jgi:thiamine biosynthesis lipoprotein